jgi:hypothetical protein
VRHVRMLGLCLVAVLAVSAYAVSSASALEFGKCEKVGAGGNYSGPNCNPHAVPSEKAKPKGTGEYEWRKGSELAPVPFSGGNVGSGGVLVSYFRGCFEKEDNLVGRVTRQKCAEYAAEGGAAHEEFFEEAISIECESEHNNGEVSGKNQITNVFVTFKGCKVFGAAPCSNTPNEGEIQVNPLKGKLGWIDKATKDVGVVLEPVTKHGEFAKFNCAGLIETVVGVGNKKEGSEYTSAGCSRSCPGTTPEEEKHGGYDGIISPITPVNEMTTKYTQVFTANPATAENIPSSFEGKHVDLLEDYLYNPEQPQVTEMWSAAGEEITNENTATEAGEIKA